MKVVFITGIFPPDVGGPATYTDGIATELSERGHDVRVLTLSDEEASATADANRPFPVERIDRGQNRLRRMGVVVSSIRRHCMWADVGFVQGLYTEVGVATMLTDTPMVVRMPGDIAWERARRLGWVDSDYETFLTKRYRPRVELLRWLRTWSVRRMDRVVAQSAFFGEHIESWGIPSSSVTQVNNFVDLDDLDDLTPADVTLPAVQPNAVVTVGRLIDLKSVDTLIDAVSGLPDTDLVVVGDGAMRDDWEAYAADRGVADRVHFVGQQPRDRALGYMRAADIFALSSTFETFSIVLLEAMSVGTPVVATDCGGPGEIINDGETGLLVANCSPRSLRDGIERLLADPGEAERLATNASATLDRYSLDTVATELEGVLAEEARTSPDP
jgi:glycosyltransferase involved in cell wall biosynthesis